MAAFCTPIIRKFGFVMGSSAVVPLRGSSSTVLPLFAHARQDRIAVSPVLDMFLTLAQPAIAIPSYSLVSLDLG